MSLKFVSKTFLGYQVFNLYPFVLVEQILILVNEFLFRVLYVVNIRYEKLSFKRK